MIKKQRQEKCFCKVDIVMTGIDFSVVDSTIYALLSGWQWGPWGGVGFWGPGGRRTSRDICRGQLLTSIFHRKITIFLSYFRFALAT